MIKSILSLPNSIHCCLWTILSLSFCSFLQGQELREYSVSCDPDEFAYIVNNPDDNIYIDCTFEYDGTVWENARIQLRGEDAAAYPKKSFKVNFDADNRFFGRDKINLKAEYNDPSFVREYLACDLYHQTGLTASQTWFARLNVNGDYLGLYLDVEQIDACFLETAGLPADASIYKAEQQGCLLSPNEDVEELWEKKTNEGTGFYDLENLLGLLENTPEPLFETTLMELFDTDALFTAIAVNAALGNQSTYYQNYFLIHDLNYDGGWEYIPWDLNNTFNYDTDYLKPDYFRSGHPKFSELNTLIVRCWQYEVFKDELLDKIDWLLSNYFTEIYYLQMVDTLSTLLYDAVAEDTLMQFTPAEFLAALNEIPVHAGNRSAGLSERIANQPLPYSLNPVILTPEGAYLSWTRSSVVTGAPIEYRVEICSDSLFTGAISGFDTGLQSHLLTDAVPSGRSYWRVFASVSPDDSIRSLQFYSVLEVPENAFGGTVVTDTIFTSITWGQEGSPYSLPEGLVIGPEAILTIEPGVRVAIGAESSIIVEGGLTAIGTAQDSIFFGPLAPDSYWGELVFNYPAQPANMAFVSMTKGGYTPSSPSADMMIRFFETDAYLADSRISHGYGGGILGVTSFIHVERVDFSYFDGEMALAYNGGVIFRSCTFSHGSMAPDVNDTVDLNAVQDGAEFSRCEFYYCGDDMLDFGEVHDAVIDRNLFFGCLDGAISLGEATYNVSITNNIFTACEVALSIKTSSSAELFNNVIALNDTGLMIPYQGAGGSINIHNTVFYDNVIGIIHGDSANLNIDYSLVDGIGVYPGEGNINADPLFVDVWNGNFYPQANSPLIDAGYGTGHPELDFLDSARVDDPNVPNTGGGDVPYVDMGVYEYYNPTNGISPQPAVPSSYTILRNWPNPFNSATRIEFSIDHSKWADIKIYNLLGQEVFTRSFENLTPGRYSLVWNGRDFNNISVASGVYFCRLDMQGGSKVTKLVMMK